MKKKALVLLSLVCAISFCGCSDQSKPEDVIQKMEDAFNEHDVDKMVECYDPEIQKMYAGAMELGGALLGGVNLNTIVGGLGAFINVYGEDLLGTSLPVLDIVINSSETVSKDEVMMNVSWLYIYDGDTANPVTVMTENVQLVKKKGKWYVAAEEADLSSAFGLEPTDSSNDETTTYETENST